MSAYQLAQLNIATLLAPLDSPQLADFVANLQHINGLGEGSPGFVWRLQDEAGDATSLRPFGDDVIVNMSVWRSIEALGDFVYRSEHVEFFRRRREWFGRMAEAATVLWWVPHGHIPSLQEAADKLALLRQQGPSAAAFSYARPFPAPDAANQPA
ncbi:DUF3291 domain-containing protein [Vogesella sp. LIG4]|uniref:DUF3291 domain-containing protein n=1 Tax=Vogesella sp. LIG4 TaxID=1192162 RepID=UPI00081FBF02|nr:DUF3291 domain-containing protein [Vogesella sp. LIG4]SCK12518.1 protein of unknown function [Vogesella sp. LIG4]